MQDGNHSKHGENWAGGPTQNIEAQHIPGYSGYIPKINSENLYGKSFAKESSLAINGQEQQDRFKTTAQAEFCKEQYRHLKQETTPAELKDQ